MPLKTLLFSLFLLTSSAFSEPAQIGQSVAPFPIGPVNGRTGAVLLTLPVSPFVLQSPSVGISQTIPAGNGVTNFYDQSVSLNSQGVPVYQKRSPLQGVNFAANGTNNYVPTALGTGISNLVLSNGNWYLYFDGVPPSRNYFIFQQSTHKLIGIVADSLQTVLTYDSLGRIVSITDPFQNITQIIYSNGFVSEIDSKGKKAFPKYDANNNLVAIGSSCGTDIVDISYTNGLPTSVSYPFSQEGLAFTYNSNGSVASFAETLSGVPVNGKSNLTYTNNSVTEATYSDFTAHTFDTTNPAMPEIETKTSVIDDKMTYATQGNYLAATLSVTSSPVGGTATTVSNSFTYDSQGHLLSMSTNGVLQLSKTYNGFGEILSETKNATGEKVSYAYDSNGLLLSVINGANATTFTYDSQGFKNSKSINGVTQFARMNNPLGQMLSQTGPTGVTTSYGYATAPMGYAGRTNYISDPKGVKQVSFNSTLTGTTISTTYTPSNGTPPETTSLTETCSGDFTGYSSSLGYSTSVSSGSSGVTQTTTNPNGTTNQTTIGGAGSSQDFNNSVLNSSTNYTPPSPVTPPSSGGGGGSTGG